VGANSGRTIAYYYPETKVRVSLFERISLDNSLFKRTSLDNTLCERTSSLPLLIFSFTRLFYHITAQSHKHTTMTIEC
jgi:hypothetical protein